MSTLQNGQADPVAFPAPPEPAHEVHAATHAGTHRPPSAPAGKDGNESNPGVASAIMQAVRRRWLPALILGVLAGTAAATAGWFFVPAKFTARSLLRVEARRPEL